MPQVCMEQRSYSDVPPLLAGEKLAGTRRQVFERSVPAGGWTVDGRGCSAARVAWSFWRCNRYPMVFYSERCAVALYSERCFFEGCHTSNKERI